MLSEALKTACLILSENGGDADIELGFAGARLFRKTRPTAIEACFYYPLICLVLQGTKDVQAGALSVSCAQGHAIVVSHDLPVLSRIRQASPCAPYLACVLPLDLRILRSFQDQLPEFAESSEPESALAAYPVDPELLDAFGRLLKLAHHDRLTRVFAPILVREIHARVLLSPQGAILRRILGRDDPSTYVARTIASIRNSIDRPLSVSALARHAGMSKSSFHDHFKAVTGLTPAQYQKDIRLLEARRLIADSDLSVSSVAFEIGYKSPAQFSRDYTRRFGRAPRDDRKLVRYPSGTGHGLQ